MIDSDSYWISLLAPQLGIAVVVLEEQHITRAARKLGVPQLTVSAAIHRLNKTIKTPLVQQSGRGIVITPAGHAFLPNAQNALKGLLVARQKASDIADPDHGKANLGFAHSRGIRDVPLLIDAFLSAYPNIIFRLQQGPADELLDQMRNGMIDVAVVAPVPDDPHLASAVLDDERLYLVVCARYRFANCPSIKLQEAAGEPFIALTSPFGLRQVFDNLCAKSGLEPLRDKKSLLCAVLFGQAWGSLFCLVAVLSSREPSKSPISSPVAHRAVAAVWLKKRPAPPAARRSIEFTQNLGHCVLPESR